MKGIRGDRKVTTLLAVRSLEKVSGILDARRNRLRRIFCLSDGWVTYARSNVIEEQYPELFSTWEIVPADALAIAKREAAEREIPVAQVLLETGAADRDTIAKGMERVVERLLFSCFEWPDGEVDFANGRPNLEGEVTVRVSPVRTILRHAKIFPASLNEVWRRIGGSKVYLAPSPNLESLGDAMVLDPIGRFLVTRCDGSSALGDLVESSPGGHEDTVRMAYGLVLAGLLELARARHRLRVATSAAGLTREECIKRLAAAEGGTHYQVLGLEPEATDLEIRNAYYDTARRYHPDRFRAGALEDLLPNFENFFTWVTEAYNVLSRPEERKAYDQKLAGPKQESTEKSAGEKVKMARQNYLRGRVLVEKKRFVDAATFFENAVLLDPTQADYHLEFGLILLRNPRRKDEAERHLLRATELAPTSVRAYLGLGQLSRRQGRREDATRYFEEALRWDPENAEASSMLAEMEEAQASSRRPRRGFFG